MAVLKTGSCVDCDGYLAGLHPMDRIVTCEDEPICRRCFNKRRIRVSMEDEDLPTPRPIIGSLGMGRNAAESVEALRMEQSTLILELFSEGL